MPEFINVVTGIRTNRWEKMLKINKRSATFIRYWRVLIHNELIREKLTLEGQAVINIKVPF